MWQQLPQSSNHHQIVLNAQRVEQVKHSLGVEDDMIMFDDFGGEEAPNGVSIVSACYNSYHRKQA